MLDVRVELENFKHLQELALSHLHSDFHCTKRLSSFRCAPALWRGMSLEANSKSIGNSRLTSWANCVTIAPHGTSEHFCRLAELFCPLLPICELGSASNFCSSSTGPGGLTAQISVTRSASAPNNNHPCEDDEI